MKFAVCVLSLGYTRLAGITLYDSKSRDFTETTPRVARELIKQGLVKGVKWKEGGFVPDPEFNMKDILVKSGVGKYRPLIHDLPGVSVNSSYVLVRVLETNKGNLYEVINNKCQRVKLTEKQLRGLCEIGPVGGVFITDDEIKICDGVIIESRVYPEEAVVEPAGIVESEEPAESMESETFEEPSEEPPEVPSEESQEEKENEPQNLEDVFKGLEKLPDELESESSETEEPQEEPQNLEDVFKGLEVKSEEPQKSNSKANKKGKSKK